MSRPDGITWSSILLLKVFCSVLFQNNLFLKCRKIMFMLLNRFGFLSILIELNCGPMDQSLIWASAYKSILQRKNNFLKVFLRGRIILFFLGLFQLVHILFYRSMLCLASFTCWLTILTSSGTTMKLLFSSESKLFLLLIHYYTRL